ncbi:MAG: hypothetical protein G5700_02720 [Serratia symbiotica]|nr:hypothetical protein [Serratia symbiotica]
MGDHAEKVLPRSTRREVPFHHNYIEQIMLGDYPQALQNTVIESMGAFEKHKECRNVIRCGIVKSVFDKQYALLSLILPINA